MSDATPVSGQRFFAVINAGSSSLKYSLFAETDDGRLERRTDGGIEGIGSDKPYFIAYDDDKFEKLLDEPELIQTPIVRNGRKATVGYAPDVWKDWE